MTNVSGVLFRCIAILLFSAFQAYIPGRKRTNVYFSVTTSEEFADSLQGRSVLRAYQWRVLLCTILAEVLVLASAAFDSPWTLVASIVVVVAGNSLAYVLARKTILPYAFPQSSERAASLTTAREGLPGGSVNILGPFLILAAVGIYLRSHWDRVPDPVPVLGDLVRGAVMDLLLLALALGILYGSRRASPVRRVNLLVLVLFLWTTSATSGISAILPLYTMQEELPSRLFPFAVLATAVAILIWAFRETRRVRDGRDSTPDECWKLGQFYYNPQDPALLVERRFGFGYTFNFANRLSWLVLTVLVFIPMALLGVMSLY
jgi:uncharacterized membrane protein